MNSLACTWWSFNRPVFHLESISFKVQIAKKILLNIPILRRTCLTFKVILLFKFALEKNYSRAAPFVLHLSRTKGWIENVKNSFAYLLKYKLQKKTFKKSTHLKRKCLTFGWARMRIVVCLILGQKIITMQLTFDNEKWKQRVESGERLESDSFLARASQPSGCWPAGATDHKHSPIFANFTIRPNQ